MMSNAPDLAFLLDLVEHHFYTDAIMDNRNYKMTALSNERIPRPAQRGQPQAVS